MHYLTGGQSTPCGIYMYTYVLVSQRTSRGCLVDPHRRNITTIFCFHNFFFHSKVSVFAAGVLRQHRPSSTRYRRCGTKKGWRQRGCLFPRMAPCSRLRTLPKTKTRACRGSSSTAPAEVCVCVCVYALYCVESGCGVCMFSNSIS